MGTAEVMPAKPPKPCPHPGCRELVTTGYCDAHKRSWTSDKIRGNRHQRGYGTKWEKVRAGVLKRDSYLCQVCRMAGRTTPATEVDHIVPKARGGKDDALNLQAICSPCHKHKTAMDARSELATYG